MAQTSPAPLSLEVVKAEGIWLFGSKGEKWLDLISGISVSNVGHRHPRVIAAIQDQLDRYLHLMVYGEYIQTPQVELAQKLAGIVPAMDSVYFVNSGTEAIEASIKLSRRATGRSKIFSFRDAYHGSTMGALSLMSSEYFTEPFKPLLPNTHHLEPDNISELDKIDADTAAVFVEIIRGEAGAIPVSPEFLKALREKCDTTGCLLIADEIQSGFGRTGPFFAFMDMGIVPDVVVMAKGMGGGMPIGAFMCRRELMQMLSDSPVLGHITTFGGHPVSCAAASATIDIIQAINTAEKVPATEQIFRESLVHPAILRITGKGLLMAAEFESETFAQKVIQRCIENGLVTDWFLFAPHKLRICPPLTITAEEAKYACRIILNSINEVIQAGHQQPPNGTP